MNQWLILFEDSGWRSLRPLTDLTPVPALAFGASNLATRLVLAAKLPLLAIEARPDAMQIWRQAPPAAGQPEPGDLVLAVNTAALPGAWLYSALQSEDLVRWQNGRCLVAARLRADEARPGIGRGADFAAFLEGLSLPVREAEVARHLWSPQWTVHSGDGHVPGSERDGDRDHDRERDGVGIGDAGWELLPDGSELHPHGHAGHHDAEWSGHQHKLQCHEGGRQ